MRQRRRLVAASLLLAVVAVACGDGHDGDEEGYTGRNVPGQAARTSSAAGELAATPSTPTATQPASGGCTSAAGLTGSVSDHGTAAVSGGEIAIDAGDSFFQPTCATDVPTGTVTLTVRNTGAFLHNVSIAEQGIDVDLDKGESVEIEVAVDGTVPYFCKYHRVAGMVGALLPK